MYGFQYDLLGRPVRTDYPGGGYERTTYDAQSRRAARIDSIPGGLLAQDVFGYDARGKMTYISGMAGTNASHFHNWYSGLGNLAGTDWLNDTNAARLTETMTGDAMGNVGQTNRWPDGAASPVAYQNTYASGMGRITHIVKVPPAIPSSDFRADSTYRRYDPAGNVTWGIQRQYGDLSTGNVGVTHHSITRNYHGADNTVRVVQVHDESGNGSSTFVRNGSYAEYRYDPLGRRIMERTRRNAEVCYNNGDNCQSTLTRFVWAGDQLLWELRVPGGNDVPATSTGLDATSATGDFYGRVSYFHAGGIDRPLLITKEGVESVVPRETWRGQFHAGTSPVTGAVRDCPIGVQTGCLQVNWPGMRTNASHSWGGEQPDIRVWYGGLVDGMRDASGQMYMRNRYYDPATGQFTQTDPIGIAGGMNVYGFAAGDPVSYSDPYGLCPEESKKWGYCPGGWTSEQYIQPHRQGCYKPENATAARLGDLLHVIYEFAQEEGKLPATADQAIAAEARRSAHLGGDYSRLRVDLWGREVRYTSRAPRFEVRSAGEDADWDTADDIVFVGQQGRAIPCVARVGPRVVQFPEGQPPCSGAY